MWTQIGHVMPCVHESPGPEGGPVPGSSKETGVLYRHIWAIQILPSKN